MADATRFERGYVSQFSDMLQFLDHQKIFYKPCAGKVGLDSKNPVTPDFSTHAYVPPSGESGPGGYIIYDIRTQTARCTSRLAF